MSIATTTALAIGGIASSAIGAGTSIAAGDKQSDAAQQAQALEAQQQQAALDFQKQQYNTQQQELSPWIQQGTGAINQLGSLVPQLNAAESAYPGFQAPTAAQAAATPGYQFTAQQGENAVQNSAAARGGLLSGNTLEAEQQYGQGLASTTYQQTYNNALQQYQQAYGQFQNSQANQFNRYASLAGVGQQAVNTSAQLGQQAATNVANIDTSGGQEQAQQINNAAAATASGYVGAGNAVSGGVNNATQLAILNKMGVFNNGAAPILPGAYGGPVGGSPGSALDPNLLQANGGQPLYA